jgi:hypothetical protein
VVGISCKSRSIGLLLLLATIGLSCRRTPFEISNTKGLKDNPPGVKFVLRTQDGRSKFHLYETIPIELAFSSEELAAYSIELDEAMNFAGSASRSLVSSTDSVFRSLPLGVIVCCDSKKRYLSPRELVLKRELTDDLRFEKPGKYSVFLVTHRIFPQMGKKNDFKASELTVTSSMLTLDILPDDPQWDARQLSSNLRALQDPEVNARYRAALDHANTRNDPIDKYFELANVVAQTELVTAQKSLNALDSDEAIEERVKLMETEPEKDVAEDARSGGARGFPQPLLVSTTRAATVEAALRKRAEEPGFGIDYDYFQYWARFMAQRDHPEVFRPSNDETEARNRAGSYFFFFSKAGLELLVTLESLVQSKKGEGKEITAITIKFLKRGNHKP